MNGGGTSKTKIFYDLYKLSKKIYYIKLLSRCVPHLRYVRYGSPKGNTYSIFILRI